MTDRIAYLKTVTKKASCDIAAYQELDERIYGKPSEMPELFRKAEFLRCFAEEIPVVIDEQELIVGSMRFWDIPKRRARNKGHIIVDYRMILREGVGGIREKIARLTTEDAKAFAQAVDAFAVFIRRYADEAARMGMSEAAADCRRLLQDPPETFRQALQLVWFVHLFLHAEGMVSAVSFGRFDDYLYPFYRRDMENGVITREAAEELVMCFYLKACEGDESQNLTLGGDIENDLTCLCLEAAAELKVQQPSISVRLCDETSDAVWSRVLRLIKAKNGMPALFNDPVIIRSLENAKVETQDAKNYAIVGCYEANSDGNTFGTTANAGSVRLYEILLAFLDADDEYADFNALYQAFRAFLTEKYNTDILDQFRRNWEAIRSSCVSPFESACMGSCLKSGVAAELGGCKYTMAGINILGIGTLVDSLYAIRRIVFEEKLCTYRDFVCQVKNNFPDRALAQRCRNLPGKYGTDNPQTNELAHELSVLIADLVENGFIHEGVTPYAGLFLFLQDVHSARYPATPDGRLDGERVSYGIGASDCCDGKTLTSVINSAAHIANDRFADGNPLMFSIPEKDVEGEKGDMVLKSLIKGYFEKGGFHLQFNVTDSETLRQAKANPQEYSDLIVRISGYSEYFTKLDDRVQTALIERS
ncbi:MAG: hypothetical protein E7463_05350 [Ruminococcaceae bacterium]|nr:hypothetical protein [Oscillospiraceae bacterium]